METILKIEKLDSFEVEAGKNYRGEPYFHSMEGYKITTTEQVITLGIENQSGCCEEWGYLMSEDDLDAFIGAEILEIVRVDNGLNTRIVEATSRLDEGGAMFINISTTKGLLQFAAYNEHNGYYSHEAVIISKQLNASEYL